MADATYQPKTYREQGGDRFVVASGGSADIESGGEIDVETGGALKIAGTALTGTAVELNKLAGVTAGAVTASKAVVVGATKNLDTLLFDIAAPAAAGNSQGTATAMTADTNLVTDADGTAGVKLPTAVAGRRVWVKNTDETAILKVYPATGAAINGLGANASISLPGGAQTAFLARTATQWYAVAVPGGITATAAEINDALDGITANYQELNTVDGAPVGTPGFVVGIEGGNVINVGIQLKDGKAADLAVRGAVQAYLSDDANGDSLAAAAPSGGSAIGTDGLLIPMTPAVSNALVVDGNLAISAVPEKFKTTQTSAFFVNGVSHTKAATDNLTFTAAHVITASKFGCVRIQINAAGTVSTKVVGTPQAYNDAPTALAALPAADAGNVSIGYIAIDNNVGDWTANTDDLTDGSDVTTAAFNDSAEVAIGAPKAFELVSESDGDIDINISEAGVATWYLVLALPNGKLAASGAITFA